MSEEVIDCLQNATIFEETYKDKDKAVYEEMDDSLERAATTATSLDAKQDRGNINKTQSKATLNEPSSLGTSSADEISCSRVLFAMVSFCWCGCEAAASLFGVVIAVTNVSATVSITSFGGVLAMVVVLLV
ncbi:hypothetical protein Tco_0651452 [Tanacetum coccineum]|uniref:Uncharacterized protein n=1 Tax=Tanacetum coccineum TaxID=301880 RepID=A0ABQ4WUU4_9ASTR